jgi:ethanolamine utilization protein EutQ (cupin superfamily)
MATKIIKSKDGINRKISNSYSVLNLLTANDSDKVSLAVSTANNHDETTKTSSDRVYYILEGELTINDDLVAKKGDVVFVSANTEYTFKGSFKAILVNSPPFKKANESILSYKVG